MDSEDWKAYKEIQKQRAKNVFQTSLDEINTLRIYPEFKVDQLTEYHYRVNGKVDLYPTTKRIFVVGMTDNFQVWKNAQDLAEKVIKIVETGKIQPKTFSLKYFIGDKSIHTVVTGAWPVCKKEKQKCEYSGQYNAGKLVIVENK